MTCLLRYGFQKIECSYVTAPYKLWLLCIAGVPKSQAPGRRGARIVSCGAYSFEVASRFWENLFNPHLASHAMIKVVVWRQFVSLVIGGEMVVMCWWVMFVYPPGKTDRHVKARAKAFRNVGSGMRFRFLIV